MARACFANGPSVHIPLGAVAVLNILPLFNIYNFCALSNRVIRVKFFYCDDFITDRCMVQSTIYWEAFMWLLGGCLVMVLVCHVTLPPPDEPDDTPDGSVAPPDSLSQLERLGALRERGLLTTAEFEGQKARLLDEMSSQAPTATPAALPPPSSSGA